MELRFVDAKSTDYRMLAQKLDDYYFSLVGDVHLRYAEANRPENMACLIVAYDGDVPMGCGCWKAVDETTAEVKRIYVLPQYRRQGVASAIIRKLEESIRNEVNNSYKKKIVKKIQGLFQNRKNSFWNSLFVVQELSYYVYKVQNGALPQRKGML